MSNSEDNLPRSRLFVMQIIAGALLNGVIIFLVIVLYIIYGQNNGMAGIPPKDIPVVSLLAVGMLVLATALGLILPGILINKGVQQIAAGIWRPPPNMDPAAFATDAAKLLTIRQTTMIVTLAPMEGTAFFGLIAFLLERQPFALGVVAAAVVVMLVNFPTAGRVRAWLERQLERLAELRLHGDVGKG